MKTIKAIKCKYCDWASLDSPFDEVSGYSQLVQHARTVHSDQFKHIQNWLRDECSQTQEWQK